ncbi:MAG: DUF7017 domain-containing protein [Thermaurantimonas sp.]|uniref:DUF7017 domain-containing protein n=1 Tax=Thermaurantimonas sp. TaxID=2681568 RepID=UPI00391DC518
MDKEFYAHIQTLIQSGNLPEAKLQAEEAHQKNPSNLYCRRSLALSYIASIDHTTHPPSLTNLLQVAQQYLNLDLPASDYLHSKLVWVLARHIFKITTYPGFTYQSLDQLFEVIKKIPYPRPSQAHSYLLAALLTHTRSYPHAYEILEWWNLKNLRTEDYQPYQNPATAGEPPKSGQKITLAERTWLAYTRLTIQRLATTPPEHPEHPRLVYKATHLLSRLALINQHNPDFHFLILYRIKLAQTLRQPIDARPEFINYARTRPKEFWIYTTLADTTGDPEQQKALLAMAINLAPKPEYSIRARKKIIPLFLANRFYQLASSQINVLITIYSQHKDQNWRLPAELREYILSEWYDHTVEIPDDQWIPDFIHSAAEIIYHDYLPLKIAIGLPVGNKIYEYYADNTHHGKARITNFTKNTQIEAGYYQALLYTSDVQSHLVLTQAIQPPETDPPLKTIEGPVKISPDGKFALIKQKYYIPPQLIQKHKLTNDQYIKALVMRSWDKKKEKPGWKCIKIFN